MKKKYIALVLVLLMAFCIGGCGQNGNTIEEPEDITVEYLTGEYADQIIRDGGEVTLGTVALADAENGSYTITVENMAIVESDISEIGYYVADTNIATTVPLDSTARITYISDREIGPEIISINEFIEIITAESYDPLEEGNEQLYDVYTIGGNALMILARELPVSE